MRTTRAARLFAFTKSAFWAAWQNLGLPGLHSMGRREARMRRQTGSVAVQVR